MVNQNTVNLYNCLSKMVNFDCDNSEHSSHERFVIHSDFNGLQVLYMLISSLGYIAAGGQRSQLTIRSLNSNWYTQVSVGGSINNALSISQHLDDTRLLVCNNDESIKVLSIPSLTRVATIQCSQAVNYGIMNL